MDEIFKKGDRAYHYLYKWGTIRNANKSFASIDFDGIGHAMCDVDPLSFTEYTLNGFSQERPNEIPKRGDVVWVRDDPDFHWEVSMFLEYDTNEPDGPYIVSPNMIEGDHECWRYLTTKNPYENN